MLTDADALPRGFRFAGLHAGIKRKRPDLGLVVCETAAVLAGTFTANRVQAAPVLLTRQVAMRGRVRSLVVNSGNANACTGPEGEADAREMQALAAAAAGCAQEEVAVASTGVIGQRLPMAVLRSGIRKAGEAVAAPSAARTRALAEFAEAMRTTDTFAKVAARSLDIGGVTVRVAGVAKGSGMIHPQMATMLAFVFTDAAVDPDWWRETWRDTVERTFNQVSVDGDTSTNDMALAMAAGLAGHAPVGRGRDGAGQDGRAALADAVRAVATDLAEMIARDGEGATRLMRVRVSGALNDREARRVARAVASSMLVKAAVHGADPNWGRVLCAAGYSGVPFDLNAVDLHIGPCRMLAAGRPVPFDEAEARRALSADTVEVTLNLRGGPGEGLAWGCDLTADYVRINADYRT